MKGILWLSFGFLLAATNATAQLNVELLHQLVAHSKDEESRQSKARTRQAVALANEEVNRSEMNRLKNKYRQLQERFKTLGLVINAAEIGIQAAPIIDEIIRQQQRILDRVADYPELALVAASAERELAGHAVQLGRYLAGLLVTIGDINQMRAADRKLLFTHVVNELRAIAGASRGLAVALYRYNRRTALADTYPLTEYINRDRELVEKILENYKSLK